MADLDPGFWAEGMAMFIHHAVSPWVGLVDRVRYVTEVNRVRAMGMTTIATTATSVTDAFALLCDLPDMPVPPVPNQTALEEILSTAVRAAV